MTPIEGYPIKFVISDDYYEVMRLNSIADNGTKTPIDITAITIAGNVHLAGTTTVQIALTVTKLNTYDFAVSIAKVNTALFSSTQPYTYSMQFSGSIEQTYIQGDCVPKKRK